MSSLLEREQFIQALASDLQHAKTCTGRIALVCGEAGIGKTTLLEHFVRVHPDARHLRGACEALFTPNPLGPLHDIARDVGGRLAQTLATGNRAATFASTVDELMSLPSPTVMCIEDVHWADGATLDLIKYVGRRIARAPALLILSYRDDEVDLRHPLRAVLGDLPATLVTRIVLSRLSRNAVQTMAKVADRSAEGLYDATAGNPFFVSEVLSNASPATGTPGIPIAVPASVRDAVLARAAPLSAAAREVLDFASIVPRAIELALVQAAISPAASAIEQCLSTGLLLADKSELRFRHELARAAIEESLSPPIAQAFHARALASLQALNQKSGRAAYVPLARFVHHAQCAGDAPAVLQYAPQAAHEAAANGAKREAAAHCRAALTFGEHMTDGARAALFEEYATYCFEVNNIDLAIAARESAIALFTRLGDKANESRSLAAHAVSLARVLKNGAAHHASGQAIEIAEEFADQTALAKAYATKAYLCMLDRDCDEAVQWGERAIGIAQQLKDDAILAGAHNAVGAARLFADYARAREQILTSMHIGKRLHDGGSAVANAYLMLGTGSGEVFELADARQYLIEGIAFAQSHDLDLVSSYMEAWLALVDMYQGKSEEAGTRANALVARERSGSATRVMALIALGRLRARRGDPGVDGVLDEALELATQSGTLQRIAPARCARAEHAWLIGDLAGVKREALAAFNFACQKQHAWFAGEMAYWLARAGERTATPDFCARPWALQLSGDWQAAARAWQSIGCPYEQARALAEGDIDAKMLALTIFDSLGARPMSSTLRAELRRAGAQGVPRGPRPITRATPHGLTAREIEVLQLVARGLQNNEVAARLFRSTRTVDNHLAAILKKIGVSSRAEAVAHASRLGLLGGVGSTTDRGPI